MIRDVAFPLSLTRPEWRASSAVAVGAVPVYCFLLAGTAAMPMLLALAGLRVANDEFGMVAALLAFAVWITMCLRGRGLARIATAVEAWALFTATCILVTLLTFVIGTGHRPLADAWLARADRVMMPGLDWPVLVRAFSRSGRPVDIANAVYSSIAWQPHLLIVVLALTGVYRCVWHFLLSWIVTLCIVMLVFAFLPALGAYAHFGITAADVPAIADPVHWYRPDALVGLRSGTLRYLDLGMMDGIVTVPSFHAGAAVLLAAAYWNIAPLRWPFAVLNALMLASAVPIGGHYVIDLVAGAIVAVAGLSISTHVLDRLDSSPATRRRSTSTTGS